MTDDEYNEGCVYDHIDLADARIMRYILSMRSLQHFDLKDWECTWPDNDDGPCTWAAFRERAVQYVREDIQKRESVFEAFPKNVWGGSRARRLVSGVRMKME